MPQHRICLIYTGGTIGMVRDDRPGESVLRPPADGHDFIERLKVVDEVRAIAKIDFVPLMNKDSTNIVPQDWTDMANAIYDKLDDGYDGFVVAHGTDTMHFSSSALAFAFGKNLNVPIVFTGAQATPDVAYGDARVNLLRALKVACENLAEVVVVFGDYIFRGCRVQKKDERRFDAFESPAEFPLGYVTEDIILGQFVDSRLAKPQPVKFRPKFADGIVQISLIPGLRPEILFPILDNEQCKGIVLQSFGAGNVPNEGIYSFEKFIRRAADQEMPVVIASQFPANSTMASHYQPGVDAVKAGAIPTGNMTNAAATVKFRWVLEQMKDEYLNRKAKPGEKLQYVRDMMNESYVKELTEAKQPSE
jgi:L-asparaginase